MFKYRQITDILGRKILDGRGLPAVEVEMLGEDGEIGSASASLEVPENDIEETAEEIIWFVNTTIADRMIGENLLAQHHIDQILERMAEVKEKSLVKQYAARMVSCAAARTASVSLGIPLYQYLGGVQAQRCPKINIYFPEGKEVQAHCLALTEKWKKSYEQTRIIWKEPEGEACRTMDFAQYLTVTQCLKKIREQKEQKTGQTGLKDTEYVTDSFLVDLAVAAGVDILELKPPVRGENAVKYTRIMRILEHL